MKQDEERDERGLKMYQAKSTETKSAVWWLGKEVGILEIQ